MYKWGLSTQLQNKFCGTLLHDWKHCTNQICAHCNIPMWLFKACQGQNQFMEPSFPFICPLFRFYWALVQLLLVLVGWDRFPRDTLQCRGNSPAHLLAGFISHWIKPVVKLWALHPILELSVSVITHLMIHPPKTPVRSHYTAASTVQIFTGFCLDPDAETIPSTLRLLKPIHIHLMGFSYPFHQSIGSANREYLVLGVCIWSKHLLI